MNTQKAVHLVLRLSMSFIFLWAFFDKLFGLGFSTPSEKAWIHGGSPTTGFLSGAVQGPFASFFHSLAGLQIVDWMFMLGLLFIGLTLLYNRYILWGSLAGILMMCLMWLALLFPQNNPIIDEHIIYALVFALFAVKNKKS
jgi:thiosulfate dehydrogenase [quinone] large subunit